jgi:hypothetical protein
MSSIELWSFKTACLDVSEKLSRLMVNISLNNTHRLFFLMEDSVLCEEEAKAVYIIQGYSSVSKRNRKTSHA